jgi:hypothetical protein
VQNAVQTDTAKTQTPEVNLLQWLKDNGSEQKKVGLRMIEVPAAGEETDNTKPPTQMVQG